MQGTGTRTVETWRMNPSKPTRFTLFSQRQRLRLVTRLAARPYNKVAEAYAKKGDYYKAIETWEWCGYNFPIPSTGIKSGTAITYFFRAGLCHVAIAVSQQ